MYEGKIDTLKTDVPTLYPLIIDEGHFSLLELPLFSIAGVTHSKTMTFWGSMVSLPIIVMVDSGASHNFISDKFVASYYLPVHLTSLFSVKLGDGR